MNEVLGFEIKKVNQGLTAYILSKNGKERYCLIRNQVNPSMLFAIYAERMGVAKVKGYGWFVEKDGVLMPMK
jgi:hypothetical protein